MSVRVLQGDVLERLAAMPADAFDCIVTSPPYWGLRDYGVAGQIGLEPTLTEYLDTMVAVCRELRRVLKPSGTFWLNIGDSYAGPNNGNKASLARGTRGARGNGQVRRLSGGLKTKDLCLVPSRPALLLQADGWYVRSEIIWHKPNPMPESVTDRPTSSHEKIWLLTKSKRYAYDADAVAEISETFGCQNTSGLSPKNIAKQSLGHFSEKTGLANPYAYETRNARNVWTIATRPYKGAHFATFPPALVERCIKAGCHVGGHVLDPFGGAGTTGLVADRLGRDATLIEINPAYVKLIKSRLAEQVAA